MSDEVQREAAVTRIAMWSGPRNLSTALMRSFENRADTAVLDEPLYASYLAQTGLDHPVRDHIIEAGPADEAAAIARCLAVPDPPATVSYQKQMSHHLLPTTERSWIDSLRNVLLIRHPARVLASYLRKRQEVTLTDIGLPQQLEFLERFDGEIPVIDSDDFLRNPRAHLEAICELSGIDFDEAMLSWPSGGRASDGVWADHWYGEVNKSTGFGAPPDTALPSVGNEHRPLLAEAQRIYDELASVRLVL